MGRPREFDEDDLLEKATDLFWRKGFEAVSVRDLAEATGVKMASLYAAYGDKRGLYRAALDHYERKVVAPTIEAVLAAGAPRARIARLLQAPIDDAAKGDRRGCFLCNATIDQAGEDAAAAKFAAECMGRVEAAIARALSDRPPYDKNLSARRRAAQRLLADYLGMRVLARGGAALSTLRNIRSEALERL